MREADGTIQGLLASLEDLFNERMYNDSGSPLRRHSLVDFDIEFYEIAEVKIDFEKHWELPEFVDYSPVFMLRCPKDQPGSGDVFTFYIVFCSRRASDQGTAPPKGMVRQIRARYNINAPEERSPTWGIWVPVYKGGSYVLDDLGREDVEGLYALFTDEFEQVYLEFSAKIERNAGQ